MKDAVGIIAGLLILAFVWKAATQSSTYETQEVEPEVEPPKPQDS